MEQLNKPLNTVYCVKCGTPISSKHHRPPFIHGAKNKLPHGYYGNRVKKSIKSVCDCGIEYISLLKSKGNNFIVIDLLFFNLPDYDRLQEYKTNLANKWPDDAIDYDKSETLKVYKKDEPVYEETPEPEDEPVYEETPEPEDDPKAYKPEPPQVIPEKITKKQLMNMARKELLGLVKLMGIDTSGKKVITLKSQDIAQIIYDEYMRTKMNGGK